MTDMFSTVSNAWFGAYNTVTQGVTQVGTQAYNMLGAITPAAKELAKKVQNIALPAFVTSAFGVVNTKVGIGVATLSLAATLLVLARRTDNLLHKYGLYVAGASVLVLSAVTMTSPFASSAKAPVTVVKA